MAEIFSPPHVAELVPKNFVADGISTTVSCPLVTGKKWGLLTSTDQKNVWKSAKMVELTAGMCIFLQPCRRFVFKLPDSAEWKSSCTEAAS